MAHIEIQVLTDMSQTEVVGELMAILKSEIPLKSRILCTYKVTEEGKKLLSIDLQDMSVKMRMHEFLKIDTNVIGAAHS